MTLRPSALAAITLAITPFIQPAAACTTGVVSGKATIDGRPLLWKNRDAPSRNNRVVYSTEGTYAYVGVVANEGARSVWMGVNEMGFAIENSVSRDLSGNSSKGPGNGQFMRIALESCANLADFEALLERTNTSGRRTMANFGVIDAHGGAAIYETSNDAFRKYDANCPETAPHGFVVRSNFSMTGTGDALLAQGKSLRDNYAGERYLRADAVFAAAVDTRRMDHRYLLRFATRDMACSQCLPLPGSLNGVRDEPLPATIDTDSTVARRSTVSAAVFHGVKPGEDPLLSTMWVLLGDPTFSIAVPCWPAARDVAPQLGPRRSPLCQTVIRLRDANYTDEKTLVTDNVPAIWEVTLPIENRIFDATNTRLAEWRASAPDAAAVATFQREMATAAASSLTLLERSVATPATTQLP